MRRKLTTILLVATALVVATLSAVTTTARPAKAAPGPGTTWPIDGYAPNESTDNAILRWDERLLESIRANPKGTGPTVAARALGVLHTATYDAWAAYDQTAVDTRQRLRADPNLRRPEAERTDDNKTEAISYAAYRVLLDLFPDRTNSVFRPYMTDRGYDPDDATTDPTSPRGVGNLAAKAVLDYRHGDNSNETHNDNGTPSNPDDDTVTYPNSPATPYTPVNTWNTVTNRWRWQPLCVPTAADLPPTPSSGTCPTTGYIVQPPLTPQWGIIKSFSLNESTHYPPQFVLPGPPKLNNGTCCDTKDVDTALKDTSNLDDVKRAKANYWADGPHSEFPPGHMAVFAQALSRMRHNTLDQDVKLFFALGSALMDASISAWRAKYQYDFVRPITAIRERYRGKQIVSWLGPGNGYGRVLGQNWRPYQETTVVTPPFPEYVSGHSTFSAAGSLVLSMAFGNSADFRASVTIQAGDSKIEPGITPATTVVISWPTLIDTADDAGWSRRWGGIHFETGDQHGRGLGKTIGFNVWNKAQTYFNGTATQPT